MKLQDLIGRTFKKICISTDRETLILYDGEGYVLIEAEKECCNTVWFEHIEGIDCLINQKILGVDKIQYKEVRRNCGEYLDEFGFVLRTSRGRVTFDMRNDNNGYYGGSYIITQCKELDWEKCLQTTHTNTELDWAPFGDADDAGLCKQKVVVTDYPTYQLVEDF